MDLSQLTLLLNRSESETLDFKRKAPDYSNATDDEKGELIKDILSMANAWKNTAAHILYGVDEENGLVKSVCGTAVTLADADIQQLVNTNTNRHVTFRIEVLQHQSVNLIVAQIDMAQNRPIYLKRNFGKLKAGAVYIRRGSSTAEATPDEIANMGGWSATSRRTLESVSSFWKLFKPFWADLEQRINYLNHTSVIYDGTIAEYCLPVEEFIKYLNEAIKLNLGSEFVDTLTALLKDLRAMDQYMKKGAAMVKEWQPNFDSFKRSAFVHSLKIKQMIPKQ